MGAIVRNVLLACLISTFAFFGAIGGKPITKAVNTVSTAKHHAPFLTESDKETFTCLGVAFMAWVLCFWRCSVINRRMEEEREYMRRFNEYARIPPFIDIIKY